jgi:hypothetical protein
MQPTKVYISSLALSKGIIEVELNDKNFISNDYRDKNFLYVEGVRFYPAEWHETRQEAVQKAEELRKSWLAKYKMNIAELEKMKF